MLSKCIASGGCFVEGEWLRNAFRWKAAVGPWEERPGHFGDVWMYWTDDGLGYFEFLQVGILYDFVGGGWLLGLLPVKLPLYAAFVDFSLIFFHFCS